MIKESEVPVWAKDFKEEIERLKKKTKNGKIYSSNQEKLKILKKTGKGNCIAIGELFMEIIKKHKVKNAYVKWFAPIKGKGQGHQVILVFEDFKKIWLQNNETINRFEAEYDIEWFLERSMNWEKKGIKNFFTFFISESKKKKKVK